jgi:hypothetical protein
MMISQGEDPEPDLSSFRQQKREVHEKGDAQRFSAPNSPEFEKKAGCTSIWKENPI